MQEFARSPTPWYKQFWPWVVFGLPACSVIAGITSVVIAVTHQDSLVRDDWYKDGVTVNRRLAADDRARALGMGAKLNVDADRGEVTLLLEGAGSEALTQLDLELSHATHAERDRVLRLQQVETGVYRGQLEPNLGGHWYATLRPGNRGGPLDGDGLAWRLSRRIDLATAKVVLFGEPKAGTAQGGSGRGR